jgi:hypothetical protein
MRDLAQELFGTYWRSVVVGPCIEGAVFEVAFQELRRNRPVAKAACFERRGKGCGGGRSWGLRFWNGYGEQMTMTTVFLPSPRISDDHQLLREPDWSRLEAYYRLRAKFLGEVMPDDFQVVAEHRSLN